MPLVTNFGSAITRGNTTLQQNLTVQGAYSTFSGNILTSSSTVGIGNVTNRFGTIYATSVNATTINTTAIYGTTGSVGVGTTTGLGATLQVQGNISATNAISASNILSTVMNVSGTTNVTSLIATSNLGIGTTPPVGGANLYITGNAYLTNALTTTNVLVTNINISGTANIGTFQGSVSMQTLNVSGTSNLLTLVATSNIGIGTTPAASGAQLTITGNAYLTNALTTSNVLSTNVNVSGTSNLLTLVATSNIGIGTAPVGSNLYVVGNAYLTNALTTSNVLSTNVNVSGTTNTLTLVATSNIGIGTAPVGANLYILGNAYLTNALTASNVFSTNVNVSGTTNTLTLVARSNIGIGTTPVGANLYIVGNAYFTNALTASNVITTNVNVSGTTNVASLIIRSNVGIGTTPSTGANLYIVGNVYLTNALLISNVISTNVNVSGTTNTLTLVATSNIGIGTNPGTTNLYVQGNAYVSNAITTTNLVASGTFSYPTDLTKRAPYLSPDSSNSSTIQNWISSTCNTSIKTKSTWATSVNPVYGNVAAGPQGTSDYSGSVVLPDGRVLFVPYNASNIGFYNPSTRLFSSVPITDFGSSISGRFSGGVLTPSGNVVFVPYNSANVGVFNPVSYSYSNVGPISATSLGSFVGGVLCASGNIAFTPYGSANIGVFNPIQGTFTNVGPISGAGASSFSGATLLPSGNVIFTPSLSTNIGVYNPTVSISTPSPLPTGAFTNVGPVSAGATSVAWNQSYNYGSGGATYTFLVPSALISWNIFTLLIYVNKTAGGAITSLFFNIDRSIDSGGTWTPIYQFDFSTVSGFLPFPTGVYSTSYQLTVPAATATSLFYPGSGATIRYRLYLTSDNTSLLGSDFVITNGSTYYNTPPPGALFAGGVLTPNGNVVFVPYGSGTVGVYNPSVSIATPSPIPSGSWSNGAVVAASGGTLFSTGALLPSANIVFCPSSSSNIGMFDPTALVFSNATAVGGTESTKFSGTSVAGNGQVVFAPYTAANVGVLNTLVPSSQEFCLSPYFNKF